MGEFLSIADEIGDRIAFQGHPYDDDGGICLDGLTAVDLSADEAVQVFLLLALGGGADEIDGGKIADAYWLGLWWA